MINTAATGGVGTARAGDGDDLIRIFGTSGGTLQRVAGTDVIAFVAVISRKLWVDLDASLMDGGLAFAPGVTFAGFERLNVTTLGGNDTILDGALDDTLHVGKGRNTVDAKAGDDIVSYTTREANTLSGGEGEDTINVSSGQSSLYFIVDIGDGSVDDGSVSVIAGFEHYIARGGGFDDIASLGAAADQFHGGDGSDTAFSGIGSTCPCGRHRKRPHPWRRGVRQPCRWRGRGSHPVLPRQWHRHGRFGRRQLFVHTAGSWRQISSFSDHGLVAFGPEAALAPAHHCAMKTTANSVAVLCLVCGIAIFSVQDLILKQISDRYPLHQAMVLRSLTAVPFMLLITRWFDGTFATLVNRNWPAMLGRGLLNFSAYTAYYLALAALPMATTVALYFTAPLFITLLSVWFLRESVPLNRWIAVLIGFAGVVIMARPGSTLFDWAVLLPIFCGLAYAASMVMARSMGEANSAAAMAFWGNNAFLMCSLGLAAVFGGGSFAETAHPSLAFLTRGWVMPNLTDSLLMCSCGFIAAVGLTLLTHAYRVGQSSVVAPFEFTFAFWGLLWGWMFWGSLPDGLGWVGIAIIVAAGLYVVRSEQTAPA